LHAVIITLPPPQYASHWLDDGAQHTSSPTCTTPQATHPIPGQLFRDVVAIAPDVIIIPANKINHFITIFLSLCAENKRSIRNVKNGVDADAEIGVK
jgi:hypothetical protein